MEVISGKYKNFKLASPGERTHPMGSRQKLALFNMIDVEGATVLDAYAGSGALGIEALSRGARRVIFVDDSVPAINTIRENLTGLHLLGTPAVKVVKSDVFDYATTTEFDVILADPPYTAFIPNAIVRVCAYLRPGGILVLSHPGDAPDFPGLTLSTTKTYARAHLSIYTKALTN